MNTRVLGYTVGAELVAPPPANQPVKEAGMPIHRTAIHDERYWSRVDRSSGGCWLWLGKIDRDGFGRFYIGSNSTMATRVSWVLANGSIPDRVKVRQRCGNRLCVNPDHLFLDTDPKPKKPCEVEGCDRREHKLTRGMCSLHYQRWRAFGSTDARQLPVERIADRMARQTDKHSHPGGCWVWLGRLNDDGYGNISVRVSRGTKRTTKVHRLAWELANGPIPDGLCVCHRCDNPSCVRPDHLFLGTHDENMRDMRKKGRAYDQRSREVAPMRGRRRG